MKVSGVVTRRKETITDLCICPEQIINEPERVFEKSDIIVVSTGDPVYSTRMTGKAFEFNLPVVTMNTE